MGNLIVGGIVLLIVVLAIGYIVKEKKKGTKCIGCSAGSCSSCSSCSDTHSDGQSSCNCDAEEADHNNYHNH